MYQARFASDLYDPQTCRDYKRSILAPGGTANAAELLTDFLGRPWSPEVVPARMPRRATAVLTAHPLQAYRSYLNEGVARARRSR